MNYLNCLEILKDNYCRGGETDKDGLYRFISGGNLLYLANKSGGWCYRYTGSTHNMVKFSIKADGKMKDGGKLRKCDVLDLDKVFQKSTKYAILTPQQEHTMQPLVWETISNQ